MTRDRLHFLFLNIGHFLDHLFTLIFATVAALALTREWGLSYEQLVYYATPGFLAFGLFSLPAGWIADRWSRHGMMALFFVGIGLASIATAYARSPLEIAIGLFILGVFAAIYHPVGLAMVVEGAAKSGTGMAIGINGVWGNLGVGSAALITGFLIDQTGWRSAFVWPGVISILLGVTYAWVMWPEIRAAHGRKPAAKGAPATAPSGTAVARGALIRLSVIIFFTTAISSLVFQSTTFSLPKVFAERLGGIAGSATLVGWLAFVVFAVASGAQIVVGKLLDTLGPRTVFMGAAALQVVFFALMPGLNDWAALAVALGLHARRLRADPHQRLHDRPHGEVGAQGIHLRRALRHQLPGAGRGAADDRLGARTLGLRHAVHAVVGGGRGDLRRGFAAAAETAGLRQRRTCSR